MRKDFHKQIRSISCTLFNCWLYYMTMALKLFALSDITPADHTCVSWTILSLPYRGTGDTSLHATWNSSSFVVTTVFPVHSEDSVSEKPSKQDKVKVPWQQKKYTSFVYPGLFCCCCLVGFGGCGGETRQEEGVKVNHTPYSGRLPGNSVLFWMWSLGYHFSCLPPPSTLYHCVLSMNTTTTERNTCTVAPSANSESALKWSGTWTRWSL